MGSGSVAAEHQTVTMLHVMFGPLVAARSVGVDVPWQQTQCQC